LFVIYQGVEKHSSASWCKMTLTSCSFSATSIAIRCGQGWLNGWPIIHGATIGLYAYGQEPADWLRAGLILKQFKVSNPHKAYREKVQGYAREENRLWEDLRHGLILGSWKFVLEISSVSPTLR
jgi:hypothetical protein